jgi:hypothetical protein
MWAKKSAPARRLAGQETDARKGGHVMRWIATLSAMIVSLSANNATRAQQTNDCKLCREYQQACLKNHTADACNNEFNICLKYCRKK